MQSKLVAEGAGERTFVMILDPGEEAFSTISEFALMEGLGAASLKRTIPVFPTELNGKRNG